MITSKIKLSEKEANAMPGREAIENALGASLDRVRPVDLEASYWQNDEATLVIAIAEQDGIAAAKIGKMALEDGADEMDYRKTKDEAGMSVIVFRIWWD